jgi:hypothetical protein
MSTVSIDVMNEVIARFMADFREKQLDSGMQLKYHTSWDWLIPVVKKIKGMHTDILKQAYVMDYMKAAAPMNYGLCFLDIEKTHAGVYSFLVWYNKSKGDKL